jgi:hypothetical protein
MHREFLETLPGEAYVVPAGWKLMPDGFPTVYSYLDNAFSLNGIIWLDDNSMTPRSGLDKVFALFRKMADRRSTSQQSSTRLTPQ